MSYSKPEITALASASFAIQGGTTKTMNHTDSSGSGFETPSAYEADE
jgi:hypothetical protein